MFFGGGKLNIVLMTGVMLIMLGISLGVSGWANFQAAQIRAAALRESTQMTTEAMKTMKAEQYRLTTADK